MYRVCGKSASGKIAEKLCNSGCAFHTDENKKGFDSGTEDRQSF